MHKTSPLYQAHKIADLAAISSAFRAELIQQLQKLDARTTYSGERGDRIAALGSWLAQSVEHYVVSCGQPMTRTEAEYINRDLSDAAARIDYDLAFSAARTTAAVSPATGREGR